MLHLAFAGPQKVIIFKIAVCNYIYIKIIDGNLEFAHSLSMLSLMTAVCREVPAPNWVIIHRNGGQGNLRLSCETLELTRKNLLCTLPLLYCENYGNIDRYIICDSLV